MKKQFIILFVMSIFLVGAVSFISASDIDDDVVDMGVDDVVDTSNDVVVQDTSGGGSSSDKVKLTISMKWNDNNSPNRPSSVTVYVKNGDNLVESVVLSRDNGWTKTVDVSKYDSSGKQISYSVSTDKISMYNDPVVTKNDNNFVITYELKQVLSASNQNNVVKVDNSSQNNSNATNGTDTNKTDSNSTGTDNKTVNNKTINNGTVNNKTVNNNTKVNNTTVNSVLVKKPPAKEVKNDTNKTKKNPLKNTGNPILILVIVIIVIAVAYYFYSKR